MEINILSKKTIVFILIVFVSAKCFSQAGFEISRDLIFLEENEYSPEYAEKTESYVFYNFDFSSLTNILSFSPCVRYDYENSPKFCFYNFKAIFIEEKFFFALQKNILKVNAGNIYKTGLIYGTDEQNKKTYWNTQFSILQNNFTYRLKYVLDTQKIEEYKIPNWNCFVLQAEFDNEKIESLISNDFYYNWDEDIFTYHLNGFVNYLINKKINMYADANYIRDKNNSCNFLTGINYTFTTKNLISSVSVEYAYKNEIHKTGFFTNFNIFDFLNLYTGVCKKINNEKELNLICELSVNIKNFKLSTSCNWENIFKEEKIFKIGVLFNGF